MSREHYHNNDHLIDNEDEAVEFDPKYQHARFPCGEITVIITWNWAHPGFEPMMCLVPTYAPPRGIEDLHIVCINMADIWRFSRTHNFEKHMVSETENAQLVSAENWQDTAARMYAIMLRLDPESRATRIKIRSIIEDHAGDLLSCPPAPERHEKTGEATFMIQELGQGKAPEEVTIKEH